MRKSSSKQHHEIVDNIVSNLTPDQLATIQSIEKRIQHGFKEIDTALARNIQNAPTTSEPVNVGERWKNLSQKQLYKLAMTHNLVKEEDDGDIPTKEQLIVMLSTITSNPATLYPLFAAQQNFNSNVKKLSSLISKLLLLMNSVPDTARTDALRKAIDQAEKLWAHTNKEKFYIMVYGELKAGKSTCLNYLLGEEVLPTDGAACTVVITELHYGDTKKLKTVDRETGKICQPPDIDLSIGRPSDTLAEFLKKTNPQRDNPAFSKIIFEWPSPILKAGIVFVDTPGLNENAVSEQLVDNYIKQAVGVLCVLNSAADGGRVRLTLQERLGRLDKMKGMEVAFICNRIDQVENPENIIRNFRDDIRLYFPNRFRSEFVIPFNARGAFQSREQGFQTPEQTTFVDRIVYYLENSFRSRLQCLFDNVLVYTKVENPIIHCVKFELEAMRNMFKLSHQNREQIAKILKEKVEEQQAKLLQLAMITNSHINKVLESYQNKYVAHIKANKEKFLDYAVAQIDIKDTSRDRHQTLGARLLDLFAREVNKQHTFKVACVQKILMELNSYANKVKTELDKMHMFCVFEWTVERLRSEEKDNLLEKCLTAETNQDLINMPQPLPTSAANLPMPSLLTWTLWAVTFSVDTWRKDTAQAWIDNDLFKNLVPTVLVEIRKEYEQIMEGLSQVVKDRLAHIQEFIENINRKSITKTMELSQTLIRYTFALEEELASFSFDHVKQHLAPVTTSGVKVEGVDVLYGKWQDRTVMLRNFGETMYSRFLQREAGIRELDHQNVARYYGTAVVVDSTTETHKKNRFLVNEFAPLTLRQCISKLDIASAGKILLGVARACSYVHEKQLRHFDLRPENILMSADLSPKISVINLCSTNPSYSDCDAKKVGYIAPELSNVRGCSTTVDIFAFGTLIHAVYANLIMPENITNLLHKCHSHDPANRPQWQQIINLLRLSKEPDSAKLFYDESELEALCELRTDEKGILPKDQPKEEKTLNPVSPKEEKWKTVGTKKGKGKAPGEIAPKEEKSAMPEKVKAVRASLRPKFPERRNSGVFGKGNSEYL